MILHEKLDRPFDQYTIRSKVWLRCDYCGQDFERVKKSIGVLNKIINKDSCGNTECAKKKREESNLARHGVKNVFQSDGVAEKTRQANLERYGSETYFYSDDFKEKRKETLVERYGVENPLQSKEIRTKQEDTVEQLYGVRNFAQSEQFSKKVKATSLEKYGTESPTQTPEVIQKRNETNQARYGRDSYTQTQEYWDQRIKTCLETYGVEHPSQAKGNRDKARATNLERYGVPNYAQTEEFREKFRNTCMARLGVPNPFLLPQNQRYGKTEHEMGEWLNSLGFSFQRNYSLINQEIDLLDNNTKIGIEYCGLYWHTELSPTPRFRDYHFGKYNACLQNGIQLITIFEDEWKTKTNQCKGILRASLSSFDEVVQARKCNVKPLSKEEFTQFCNAHHLLGSNYLGVVFYALLHRDQIVGAMSLGRHHRNQELLTMDRLCFTPGIRVIGGASRLLSRCVKWAKENGVHQIITWSDNRWSRGTVYQKMGFTLSKELGPDYAYVNLKRPYNRISKQSQKKNNTRCPENMTEWEWSASRGLARIWDCGKKRWILNF